MMTLTTQPFRWLMRYPEWHIYAALTAFTVLCRIAVVVLLLRFLAPDSWFPAGSVSLASQVLICAACVAVLVARRSRCRKQYWLMQMANFYNWQGTRCYWATAKAPSQEKFRRLEAKATEYLQKSSELRAIVSMS